MIDILIISLGVLLVVFPRSVAREGIIAVVKGIDLYAIMEK